MGELDDVRILGTEFEERLEARPKGPRGFPEPGEVALRDTRRLGCELSMSDLYLVVFEISIFAAA